MWRPVPKWQSGCRREQQPTPLFEMNGTPTVQNEGQQSQTLGFRGEDAPLYVGNNRGAPLNEPIRILCVAGARPNFMKLAPLFRALDCLPEFRPVLVHTGQHYDDSMSGQFFRESDCPCHPTISK